MRPGDVPEGERLADAISRYEDHNGVLPGLAPPGPRETFVEQLIESERRRRFVRWLVTADLTLARTDPSSELFDPLKAAALHRRAGHIDEAFWMVFLFVQFGRSRRGGWRYAREVYGRRGEGTWDWHAVAADPASFRAWFTENAAAIRNAAPGGFGNHRKYESLARTGEVVGSYVDWVGPTRSHADRFERAIAAAAGDARAAFADLYASMATITRFGRTARFDYLATADRLALAAIEPDRAYLSNATGPLTGARLLFGRPVGGPHALDDGLRVLGSHLGLGMDVVEDAVCNWQKSPAVFKPFRG